MKGDPLDYNVALYVQGYDTVLARQFSHGWTDVSNPAGTWDPLIAQSEFQQQYSAHKNINAALIPSDDENSAPIISYLQTKGIKARTFPTTGQDATFYGLQNILAGYQCGTVYKPIYLEAQAAAALAMYVRAKVTPPASLLMGNFTDPQTHKSVASVLLTPEWVTTQNMNSTVIADKFVPASRSVLGQVRLGLLRRWYLRLTESRMINWDDGSEKVARICPRRSGCCRAQSPVIRTRVRDCMPDLV